jgi:tetratricopeptide (TPR) repeat protein
VVIDGYKEHGDRQRGFFVYLSFSLYLSIEIIVKYYDRLISMIKRINRAYVIYLCFIYQACTMPMLLSQSLTYKENIIPGTMSSTFMEALQEFKCGEIEYSVKCLQQTDQSYALYLPVHYLPAKRWPVIYVFDPGARGSIPVELMKEAAEKYGYIVAASNNSRNGPWEPEAKAAQAMWEDTHRRLSINDSCVYFAGFSGGARVAAYLAQSCKCAQGVLLNGAGFSTDSPPSSINRFAVFGIVGFTDMNYTEMVKLDKTLETLGFSHFLRRFNGSHQWGPKEVWQEAFAWMRLIAIKNGRQPRDEQFISVELAAALQRAQIFEDSGDVFFAWQNYSNVSKIFQGLTDTKKIDDHVDVLAKNFAVIEGQEKEENEIEEQIKLQSKILDILDLMNKPKPKWPTGVQLNDFNESRDAFSDLQTQARRAIRWLRNDFEGENELERHRILERASSVIFGYLMETARFNMDSKDLQNAKDFFELAIEMRPNVYGPHLSLARCLVLMGDKEEAIKELSRAREVGLSAQALVNFSKQIAELNSLIDDPKFQKLIIDVPTGQ